MHWEAFLWLSAYCILIANFTSIINQGAGQSILNVQTVERLEMQHYFNVPGLKLTEFYVKCAIFQKRAREDRQMQLAVLTSAHAVLSGRQIIFDNVLH